MLPDRASRIMASSGSGSRISRALADMIMPVVQKPHWMANSSTKARCSTSSSPEADNPSMVVTCRPSSWMAKVKQAWIG